MSMLDDAADNTKNAVKRARNEAADERKKDQGAERGESPRDAESETTTD
ncbi:hypothetical protein [Leucobacter sp. NPDC077196]